MKIRDRKKKSILISSLNVRDNKIRDQFHFFSYLILIQLFLVVAIELRKSDFTCLAEAFL